MSDVKQKHAAQPNSQSEPRSQRGPENAESVKDSPRAESVGSTALLGGAGFPRVATQVIQYDLSTQEESRWFVEVGLTADGELAYAGPDDGQKVPMRFTPTEIQRFEDLDAAGEGWWKEYKAVPDAARLPELLFRGRFPSPPPASSGGEPQRPGSRPLGYIPQSYRPRPARSV